MTEEERQIEKERDEARQRWLSMPIANPWEQRESIQEVVNAVKSIMPSLVTPRVRYEVEVNHPEIVRIYIWADMGRGGFEVDTYYLMMAKDRRGLIAHHLYATLKKIMEAAYLK